jgi:hypothetical protein
MKTSHAKGRSFLAIALLASLAFVGCAPSALVMVSPNYNPSRVRSVALLGFQDYFNLAGSGQVAAGIFEKYLLLGGYTLVDRSQAQKAMDQQNINLASGADLQTLRKIGQTLGVDAVAIGQLSDYSEASYQTVVEDQVLEQSQPILGQVTTVQRDEGVKTRTEQDVIIGYNNTETHTPIQETEENPAHVAMSVRLVDVETGEMLWSGSASGHGNQTHEAAEEASAEIMKSVVARLKQIK